MRDADWLRLLAWNLAGVVFSLLSISAIATLAPQIRGW